MVIEVRIAMLTGREVTEERAGLWACLGADSEKAMALHSSTLAWKIPWAEDLVGCSPWGLEESDTTE